MDFGATLSRALKITWDHKILWLLGFLAALGSGGIGSVGQSPQMSTSFSNGRVPPWMQQLADNYTAVLAGLTVFACVVVILGIVLYVVGIIARGGLISGVAQIETDGRTTFGKAWSSGSARFWPMLGLNLVLLIPVFIMIAILVVAVLGIVGAGVFAGTSAGNSRNPGPLIGIIGGGIFVLCCGLCIFFIIALLIGALQTFGERAIVLEKTGVFDGISHAWSVFKANLGNIILLALVMWLVGVVFGIVTGGIAFVVLLPTVLPLIAEVSRNGALTFASALVAVAGVVVATILVAIINTLYITFNSTTWTLAYRQFIGAAPVVPAPPAIQPPLPAA
jgi:hypothetical protein